jgi:hypothetical protein
MNHIHCGYWIHFISAENPMNPRIHWIFPLKECPINFSDSLNVFFSQLMIFLCVPPLYIVKSVEPKVCESVANA